MLHGRRPIQIFLIVVRVFLFCFSINISYAQYIMPAVWQNTTIGGAVDGGGTSVGSLRFRAGQSTNLEKTFGSAGNRKTWTYSAWIKRGKLTYENYIFAGGTGNGGYTDFIRLYHSGTDRIIVHLASGGGIEVELVTNAFYRDTSAWIHIVLAVDTTQATDSNRVKLYVNGKQVISFLTENYPAQNYDTRFINNSTARHNIGIDSYSKTAAQTYDGHMTEVHFVDGQALTPSDFATRNTITKSWQPKAYTGTYGSNGFHLDFADSADLGDDNSGNTNDWTPNNFATTDGMLDTPDANFATMNRFAGSTHTIFSDSNLVLTGTSAGNIGKNIGTIGVSSGKWYWEVEATARGGTNSLQIGVTSVAPFVDSSNQNGGESGSAHFTAYNTSYSDAAIAVDGSAITTGISATTNGQVIGIALDIDAGKVYFFRDGIVVGDAAGYTATNVSGTFWPVIYTRDNSGASTATVNFGQGGQSGLTYYAQAGGSFKYAPPSSSYKALRASNLISQVVAVGTDYFKTITYTGNGTYMSIGSPAKIDSNYQIDKSLRFDGSAAYLNRSLGGDGNTRTFTWSSWLKRGSVGDTTILNYAGAAVSSSDQTAIQFRPEGTLQVVQNNGASNVLNKITKAKFLDSSSWLHIVVAFDTTQAVAEDRIKLFINGVRVTEFGTNTIINQNSTTYWHDSSYVHRLGKGHSSSYFNGYLADVHNIDGLALGPTNFGEFDSKGIWIPKAYAGAHGTNGFHLDFSDETNVGKDANGSNDYTSNNFTTDATSPFKFETTGFKVGSLASLNTSSEKYVSWNWKEGVIPGLDIITYGGTGANQTLSTNLNSPAEMLWIKDRSGTNDWAIYHHKNTTAPETDRLLLNSTAATVDDATYWNDTKPFHKTLMLIHGDGADASTTFTDVSNNQLALTIAGDTQVDTAQSKVSGASMLFDGSGDYIGTPSSSDMALGGGDFTVEFWVRFGSIVNYVPMIGSWSTSSNAGDWRIYSDATGTFGVGAGGGSREHGASFTTGQWYHLAIARSGSTVNMFLDGTLVNSFTGGDVIPSNHELRVGSYFVASLHYANMQMDELRITKGEALYTASFTPSTTPYTVDAVDSAISLGTNADVNASGNSYVAYAFDEVPGFSKFGTYTGNGSTDGPFVYTGFKPKYVLIKDGTNARNWFVYDSARGAYNVVNETLRASTNNAETSIASLDFLSNGFKIRHNSASSSINDNGSNIIYAAFAETPLKESAKAGAVGIASSLRLNDNDSAYLSRTPASAGNQKTWSWSAWVKPSDVPSNETLFEGGVDGVNRANIHFDGTGKFGFYQVGSGTTGSVASDALFRDPSRWIHFIVVADTTQAVATDRIKLYADGVRLATTSTGNPDLNADMYINRTNVHRFGSVSYTVTALFDGHLSDVHFVDGQALSPSDFGEADSNSYWRPKTYVGTYGTNGFHLDFADSADLGDDNSGNSNDWSPSNIDATDYVIDTPTNSFATFNPIDRGPSSTITISNGNLDFSNISGAGNQVRSTLSANSGKWYWEMKALSASGGSTPTGMFLTSMEGPLTTNSTPTIAAEIYLNSLGSAFVSYKKDGVTETLIQPIGFTSVGVGDSLQMAYDADNGKVWFGKNNSWLDGVGGVSGNPVTGVNPTLTIETGYSMSPALGNYGASYSGSMNFGQGGQTGLTYDSNSGGFFKYTPPSGFKALSTSNLPVPTVTKPSDYFNSILHTGNGTEQSVNVGFKPNLTWIKNRDTTDNHMIFDSKRPAGAASLTSNSTAAEVENFDETTVDLFVDVPAAFSDGDGEHGNYMTLNPLAATGVSGSFFASEGNLKLTVTNNSGYRNYSGTMNPAGLKGYYEVEVTTGTPNFYIGFEDMSRAFSSSGYTSTGSIALSQGGNVREANSTVIAGYTSAFATGDTLMVAFDFTGDNKNVWFGRNGAWGGTGNPVAATNPALTSVELAGDQRFYFASNTGAGTQVLSFNFGQSDYKYSIPTGFKRLNTLNLPQNNFVPDLVWIKNRSSTTSHALYDSQRGVTLELNSDSTAVESSETNGLLGFNFGGFNTGSSSLLNTLGNNYVAWMWKKGTTPGFDVVTYTGDGGAAQAISHSLGKVPAMIVVKARDEVQDWRVYHQKTNVSPKDYRMNLNQNIAAVAGAHWSNTSPTTTQFTVNACAGCGVNASGKKHVAYVWSEVEGFSKFGSYIGNGNANGTFVYTGFRPAFVMAKRIDSTGNWLIFDTGRLVAGEESMIKPDTTDAESTGDRVDLLSNGFKLRDTDASRNGSGATYIFVAFAEKPLRYAKGR